MKINAVQSIGVDVLRARYRQQRRQLLSAIILQKKADPSIEDVKEDLQEIDQSRIYGLGVTLEEFRAWKKATSR